ncbi:MAG: NosD domain-containing protein [Verrucomicrobiota bacterium]|jgi:hypothetical protein
MPPTDFRQPRLRLRLCPGLLLAVLPGLPGFGATPVMVALPAQSSGAEMQKALDSLPPGGELILSAGTYEITQPLLLRHDGMTMRGRGGATILHLADQAECPVVVLGPPMTERSHPAAHLRLADLVIDGNRKNQKAEGWRSAGSGPAINNNGVQIWNVTDAVVEHVVCCRCRSGGLVTVEVRRLLVSDYDAFDNQFDGLACYQTQQSRFAGLRLHDNLAAGISLDLEFDHNWISNAVLSGNDLGVFMRDSRDNWFQGLTICKSRHDGVFMAQTASLTAQGWQYAPDTECVGNRFENLVVNDCGGKAFQVNDASCRENTISGAHFQGNLLGGLAEPTVNLVRVRELVDR